MWHDTVSSRDLIVALNISSKYLHNTALIPLVSLKTCRGNFTYLIMWMFSHNSGLGGSIWYFTFLSYYCLHPKQF
jgi:hypothetical protein